MFYRPVNFLRDLLCFDWWKTTVAYEYLILGLVCGIGASFVCLQIYSAKFILFSEVSHLFSRYWTGWERIFLAGLGKHCFAKLPRTKEFYLKVILWIIPGENILFWNFFSEIFLQIFNCFLEACFQHFFRAFFAVVATISDTGSDGVLC